MMRPGFTIIELSISLFIASLLAFLLYDSFSRSQKNVQVVDGSISYVFDAPVVYNQLKKDIGAIFVPSVAFKDIEEQQKKKRGKEQKEVAPAATDEKKTAPKEPFKNIFVGSVAPDGNLSLLSFLSTNSLVTYNAVKPRSVRVAYRLVPDTASEGLFTLQRQEALDLSTPLEKFTEPGGVRAYELMRGIKKFTVQYRAPEREKKQENKKDGGMSGKKAKKSAAPQQYVTRDAWSDEEAKKLGSLVPHSLLVKGVAVDASTGREYDFEWRFELYSCEGIAQRVERAEHEQKKVPQQPEAGDSAAKGDGTSPTAPVTAGPQPLRPRPLKPRPTTLQPGGATNVPS